MIVQESLHQSAVFTADEARAATTFTDLQIAYLRNELAMKVSMRLSLELDVNNVLAFTQEEAYYKGQIELLTELLNPQQPSLEETPEQLP